MEDKLPRRIWFTPLALKRHLFAKYGLLPVLVGLVVTMPFIWLIFVQPNGHEWLNWYFNLFFD